MYMRLQLKLDVGITKEGRLKRKDMPVELLEAIANKPLPLTLTNPADIDKLRVLRAAGYVAAMLPVPGTDQAMARVLHITSEGRRSMTRAKAHEQEFVAGH